MDVIVKVRDPDENLEEKIKAYKVKKRIKTAVTILAFVFDKVTLESGKNILKATVSSGGKEYTDEMEWMYNGEMKREADFYENPKEHAGW